jgi:FkbM family methyltransferase
MSDEMSNEPGWGTYPPPREAASLLGLVRLGLARGGISKWIRRRWHNQYPELVDAEIRGIKFRLNISDNTTDEKLLLSSKYYDGEEIDALSNRGGGVFVDVGANTGYYSLMLASRGFEKVISIEPNPPTVNRLAFNVAINNMSEKIHVVPLCVGKEGTVEFYCNGSLGSASLIQERADIAPISVPSKPLIMILEDHHIEKIDSMKVDVEGFEDKALIPFFEASTKKLWPRVLVLEHCHSDIWEKDLLEYLLDDKYELIRKTRANAIMKRIDT